MSSSHTPLTPSLLTSLNANQLLSRTRLRLIASMSDRVGCPISRNATPC